ncbi:MULTISPECIES: bifunctional homocysteine S-methyltransferase/methylenetetrahydrofolate reductase [unclassified Paenibacillus]|uniref:bifunctional homocysteine S-methyltransferase/methylenetetrahydrofolate reductase n=1 Tax=unclassified Paenibacillus TaxID=185978 RepID=UPI002405E42D|nr:MULTISPECIES: bifunctional homocysteine S-methyltransferase/methylenetetrahydrofolate reductase [unclassified Paenibacillus]MDF9842898.1 methionine synthase I (cobalamin-dependent)/5,10-methylenetetrahydrofolate reductase [Paenibacillus sp. PastF-2]MDF9849486.1 methionine synthase I (cobalamin-dependent)/5,10-methylenetetrahydrofolate reductase [Paenibacillus sp. PastM-2]MDF9856139.1 methionine synthase I (cobalamin-dependent)/5,10-methylenetetrahydrofolate reductase [Paenibacillus sp. PastF-
MKPDLRSAWKNNVLVGDGAMGTFLYQKGFPVGISYEELNLNSPEVIEDVHRSYIEAGAVLLESNTYSANYDKLAKFGLEGKVEDINRAGVRIARKAAGEAGYVVGAVGSIRAGKRANLSASELKRFYTQQFTALLEEQPDGIMLETFYDVEELHLALKAVRKLSGLPVICQLAVDETARTLDGLTLPEAFRILEQDGADIIGFNCRTGPNGIKRALTTLQGSLALPVSVYPNAGIADYVDGQYRYGATPDYFGQMAPVFADMGSRIIGGCCGTTPQHIAEISAALRGYVPQPLPEPAVKQSAGSITIHEHLEEDGGRSGREPNLVDLVKERHTVIVELDPPRDLDITKFMKGAEALRRAGADALTLADNSLAVTRMSNMALGSLVQARTGLRPLVHVACRDRNLIGTQSHLMGFDALGIDHVLAVTGDPARFGDLPGSSSIYDLTSFEIIRMIKQLNDGIAFSGKPLKQKAKFVIGAAFNPNVKHLDKAVQRLEKKIASGADYIMTQPVYDPELIANIAAATKHLDIPIFLGIMPLASGRNAEYLHNEVPGIQLSDEVRRRMQGLEGEAGRAEGVAIAKELLDAATEHFNGIYLMTPFMFYDMSVQLLEYIWTRQGRKLSPLFR